MATQLQTNYHDIKTMAGDIHQHMELVVREMKKTEKSYLDRDYKFEWDGLSTYTGLHDLGMTGGFTTRLRYWVSLLPIDEPRGSGETSPPIKERNRREIDEQ